MLTAFFDWLLKRLLGETPPAKGVLDDPLAWARDQRARRRRLGIWLASLGLLGLLAGLSIGRLTGNDPLQPPRLGAVLVSKVADGATLQLRLAISRRVRLERLTAAEGALRWRMVGLRSDSPAQAGRERLRSGWVSWSLTPTREGLELYMIGLGGPLSAHASFADEGWLQIEARPQDDAAR